MVCLKRFWHLVFFCCLLSGCTASSTLGIFGFAEPEQPGAPWEISQAKDDTNFRGIIDYALSLPAGSTYKSRIVFFHGMCSKTKDSWITPLIETSIPTALNKLDIEFSFVAQGEGGKLFDVNRLFSEDKRGEVQVFRTLIKGQGTDEGVKWESELYFVLHSGLFQSRRDLLREDQKLYESFLGKESGKGKLPSKWVSQYLETSLFIDCLAEVADYAAEPMSVIEPIKEALVEALSDSDEDFGSGNTFLISHSLGSRIMTALIASIGNGDRVELKNMAASLKSVFMFANQIPFFLTDQQLRGLGDSAKQKDGDSASRNLPEEITDPKRFTDSVINARSSSYSITHQDAPSSGSLSSRPDSDPFEIVNFSDPNDFLSYNLKPDYMIADNNRTSVKLYNVFVDNLSPADALSEAVRSLLFLKSTFYLDDVKIISLISTLKSPLSNLLRYHQDYTKNTGVLELVLTGGDKKLSD